MDLLRWCVKNRLLLLLLGVIAAFQLVTIRPGFLAGEDTFLYLSHARNLAFGWPYGATDFIHTTEAALYSPAAYPPVFPILLAPVYRFSGLNPHPYKILLVCTLMLCLVVIARLYRNRGTLQLLLVVALLGFNPFITEQKNQILSDLPFLLFVCSLLALCSTLWERDGKGSPYFWPGICVGLLSYLAYGTRSIGIGLIPCIIAFGLIRYRRIASFSMVAAGVFALLAMLQSWLVSSNSDYLRLAVWDPLSIGYGLFLIFWPMHQGRYLLPLLPVYLYLVARGLFSVRDFISRRWPTIGTVAAGAVAGILLLTYAGKYRTSDFGPNPDAWDSAAAMQLYDFVRDATPQNAIFIAGGPRALALYTGRRAARFPEQHMDRETLSEYIDKVGATYLVASRIDSDQWAILCRSLGGTGPVFSNPSYTVYKASPVPSGKKLSSP